MQQLSTAAWTFIAKLADKHLKKKDTPALEAGSYEFNQTVSLCLDGTLNKGEDYDSAPTVSIPLKIALALMLEKMGCMREKVAPMLREAMFEALEVQAKLKEQGKKKKKSGEGTPAECAISKRILDVEKVMELVEKDVIATLPRQPKSGSTTVKGSLTQVEVAESVDIEADDISYLS